MEQRERNEICSFESLLFSPRTWRREEGRETWTGKAEAVGRERFVWV